MVLARWIKEKNGFEEKIKVLLDVISY